MTGDYGRDEDLLQRTSASGEPGVSLYRYPRVEAVIGRGGKTAVELHQEALLSDGVPVVRRRGGGCAVVLDPGNVIVSVALPLPGVGGIRTAFDTISDWMIDLLAESGIPGVRQRGVSDLVLGERKIGGSCIWRTRNLLYYTTTLLVDPEPGLMDRYLKHPPREPDYRQGRSHDAFTTSLAAEGLAGDPDLLIDKMRATADRKLQALYKGLVGKLGNLKPQVDLQGEAVNQ